MVYSVIKHKMKLVQIKEYLLIALVVILFNHFVLSCNLVPTSSMVSTINEDDRILVNRLSYYYRQPKRGEIVVFKNHDEIWVKRLIGLPGETIDIINGNIYIDGELYKEEYLVREGISTPNPLHIPITFPYKIPEHTYFLMGDNRLESHDSRYIGAISEKNIIGKAIFKIFPFNKMCILR